MTGRGYKDSFWLSYSDLMTSLFFIMLVLFIVCISKMMYDNEISALQYVEEKKTFVAKDFIGIEIFNPLDDTIKSEYLKMVDKVGNSLLEVVKRLYLKNPDLNFQLVIEGNAAIPWNLIENKSYNADNVQMYELSYRRALALYRRWKSIGVNLRNYNTEIIIAGSGFNGINRDEEVEENNKRFVIQIIPKISKPVNN